MRTSSAAADHVDPAAELALRFRVEELIAGFAELGIEDAIASLTDVETVASALAGSGLLDAAAASSLVADTVDALVVRGAPWIEVAAVDLDVRRLYDLVAGAPRPRLRRVVAVGSLPVPSIDVWDDHAEARVVGAEGGVRPSLLLDPVGTDEIRLELWDDDGRCLDVDLTRGRAAAVAGVTRRLDGPGEYLSRLVLHAVAATRRDPSIDNLNAQRRRVAVAADALGAPTAFVESFDAQAAGSPPATTSAATLLEVVPVAVRAPFGWVLSVESWSDHWRAVVRADGHGPWTAVDDAGSGYGGGVLDGEVVRFDPLLPATWSSLTLRRLEPDGTSVEVEVVR